MQTLQTGERWIWTSVLIGEGIVFPDMMGGLGSLLHMI